MRIACNGACGKAAQSALLVLCEAAMKSHEAAWVFARSTAGNTILQHANCYARLLVGISRGTQSSTSSTSLGGQAHGMHHHLQHAH